MAEDTEARAETTSEKPAAKGGKTAAPAKGFPRERLVRESYAFFGVPSYVAAGALEGSADELTLDEARQALADFATPPDTNEEGAS